MKRITLFSFFVALFFGKAIAQQIPLYSQYYLNPFLYNPARAGDGEQVKASLIYRKQWVDVTGAPETRTLTVDGSLKNQKAAFGGMIYQDNISFFRKSGGSLSYAYSFNFNEKHRLSLGLSAGLNEISINRAQVKTEIQDEPLLQTFNRGVGFDGSAGINYRYKTLNIGFSIPQLFESDLSYLNDDDLSPLGFQLSRHYLLNASYGIELMKDVLTLEPSAFFRITDGAEFQVDVNAKLEYKKLVWLGLMYRYDYAFTVGAGFKVHDKISVGYSTDFAVNDLNNVGGTHEVFLSVRFGKSEDKGLIESIKQLQDRQNLLDDKINDVGYANDSLKNTNESLLKSIDEKDKEIADLKAEIEKKLKEFQESMKNQSPPVNVDIPKNAIYEGRKEDLQFIDKDPGSGYFMVVAATRTEKGARQEQKTYKDKGYDVGIVLNKRRSWYYLYLSKEGDFETGIKELYQLREKSEFKDAWIHIYK